MSLLPCLLLSASSSTSPSPSPRPCHVGQPQILCEREKPPARGTNIISPPACMQWQQAGVQACLPQDRETKAKACKKAKRYRYRHVGRVVNNRLLFLSAVAGRLSWPAGRQEGGKLVSIDRQCMGGSLEGVCHGIKGAGWQRCSFCLFPSCLWGKVGGRAGPVPAPCLLHVPLSPIIGD